MNRSKSNLTVTCLYCDRQFREVEHMEQHCDDVHSFSCQYCGELFAFKEDRDAHDRKKHLIVECLYCDKIFREVEHMEQHCDAVHSFPCQYCDELFAFKEERDAHDREEHLTVECLYCDKIFREVEHMEQHCDAVHSFPCQYCDELFAFKKDRAAHDRKEHLTVECLYCNKIFREVEHMEQHCDDVHSFPCQYCGELFAFKEDRDAHDREEHLTVECLYCDKIFREVEHMEQHCDAVHSFLCQYCDELFAFKEDRDAHDREEHLTVTCLYCNRIFREVEHMEQHKIAKHAEKNYYSCHYCEREFNSESTRDYHERYYH